MDMALKGYRVLDLGQVINAPYGGWLLALMGAEVIKVEPPGGDFGRQLVLGKGEPVSFHMLNSNKKSITLNLKTVKGKKLFQKLVAVSDIVLENYTPGVMERLGLGYQRLREINPRIIYASSTGFGRSGPYKGFRAFDPIVQAISGIMSVTGFPDQPPVKTGPALVDWLAGTHLALGTVAALLHREQSGVGQEVEVSMLDTAYHTLAVFISRHFRTGDVPTRTGNRQPGGEYTPYNSYKAKDGYVLIFCQNDENWQKLLEVMGRLDLMDDNRYKVLSERQLRMDEVDEIVQQWVGTKTKSEAAKLVIEAGIPCGPVNDLDEVMTDPHLLSRGIIVDVDHPTAGRFKVAGPPLSMSDTPLMIIDPSPGLGQHNREVFEGLLGYSSEDLERFGKDGVV